MLQCDCRWGEQVGFAAGGDDEGAVGEFGEEKHEGFAARIGRAFIEAIMDARKMDTRFVLKRRPVPRGMRARVGDDLINGAMETQDGERVRRGLELLGQVRRERVHQKAQG